jgi:superfamily I DNA/RNA helicase
MSAFSAQLKPTDEQQEIIDVVHTGVDTVIEAGAGTGKTSQLKMIAQNEASRRGLCIYFNREPAAQARRTFPPNVACSTAHSLAWHAMKDHPAMERLDGDRVSAKMLAEDYLGITRWFKTPEGRKDVSTWKIASMAVNAVKRFCYSDAAQDHLQRIFVGDSQQRLFSWRGTVNMMDEFPDAVRRYLTQSWRFGDAVAEEANLWLEYLESPLRLRGLSSINSRLDYLEAPDAILCRTNAAVIEQAMNAQSRGFDVGVVGGTDEISSFTTAAEQLRLTGKTSHRELALFKTWGDVLDYVESEKPDGSFSTFVRLIERYGTGTVRQVAANCVAPREADFVVSTVHKVKGLEWSKVLLDPSLTPSQEEGQDIADGELMTRYVAVTRAQDVLDASVVQPFHQRRRRVREVSDRAAAKQEVA